MTPAQGDDASDDSDLSALLTESVDPRYADLDILSVAQLAELMNAADRTVPDAVHAALPQIVLAVEAILPRMIAGGRLVYVGAGTADAWESSTRQSVRRPSTPGPSRSSPSLRAAHAPCRPQSKGLRTTLPKGQ